MKTVITRAILGLFLIALSACGTNAGSTKTAQTDMDNPADLLPESESDETDLTNASEVYTDIAYANLSEKQKIDIYIPKGDGPFPVIFAIHGGAFMLGSKVGGGNTAIIESGLERGYAVVGVGYRLSGEAIFPAAVDDVLASISYVRENADVYNLDGSRFVAWGGSAGGTLAAMAATKGDAGAGTNVQAAIDWFGPIMFNQMDAQFESLDVEPKMGPTSSIDSPESKYLGVNVGDDDALDLVLAASPQTYISANDPAMYIQHGTDDRMIPITQSVNFANELSSVIGDDKVVFEALEGAGHGGPAFESEENLAKIYNFLELRLD